MDWGLRTTLLCYVVRRPDNHRDKLGGVLFGVLNVFLRIQDRADGRVRLLPNRERSEDLVNRTSDRPNVDLRHRWGTRQNSHEFCYIKNYLGKPNPYFFRIS